MVKMVGAGAGGGGGNYSLKVDTSESGCAAITGTDTTGNSGSYAIYEPASNLCVTKYNQVSNPETYKTTVMTNRLDINCTSNYTHTCSSNQNSMKYPYSGCSRPVCTHVGAKAACQVLASRTGLPWRLPKYEEMQKWTNSYKTLALCTNGNYNTAVFNEVATCAPSAALYSGSCAIDNDPGCIPGAWPRDVWAEEIMNEKYSYRGYLGAGWEYGPDFNGGPHTVRCVLEKTYNYYTGGGSSSGQYLEFEIPQKALKTATKNGNAVLYIVPQNGGKSGQKNENGYRSTLESAVLLYDNKNTYIQGTVVYNGYAGGAATTSADGVASTFPPKHVCWYFDSTNPLYANLNNPIVECRSFPELISYSGGNSGSGITGGASVWPGGGNYGAGGNGGTCELGADGNPKCTTGEGGKGGRVEVYFKHAYPGAGGSGGNAGSFLHIKNIQVKAGDKIKIQAGKAGSGGAPDNSGTAGGNSVVEFPNGKKYEVLGGKPALAGTLANPSTGAFAKSGNIENITENDVITPSTRALLQNGDEVYPATAEEMALLKGLKAQETTDINTQRLSGGNGGVNSKISGLAGVRGIPCGGYSTTPVVINKTKYSCGADKQLSSTDYNPTPLYRTLTEDDLKIKISNYIHNYAPGGTGGGGGAWSNDFNDTSEKIGRGQDGMGGYVIIYFSS